eukprot:SAG31_NODE_168_length_21484_cov_21.524994_7_plen_126_part_00
MLSDHYGDLVVTQGSISVRDAENGRVSDWQAATGDVHTVGRIIGTGDAYLRGSAVLAGPLRDQESCTIQGQLTGNPDESQSIPINPNQSPLIPINPNRSPLTPINPQFIPINPQLLPINPQLIPN